MKYHLGISIDLKQSYFMTMYQLISYQLQHMYRYLVLFSARIATTQNTYLCFDNNKFLIHVLYHFTIDLNIIKYYTIILSFFFIYQFTNSMFFIIFKITLIFITICIDIFTFSLANTIYIISIILICIRIDSIASSCIITWRFARYFLSLFSKLKRCTSLLFCHLLWY
jgi:hypothetical protein